MEKKITSHITKGLIIALITIVIDLIGGFAHVKFSNWFNWVPTIALVIGIIWACISFGTQNDNQVSFGNIFAHGFKTTAVITCISLIYFFISVYLIFPETKDLAIEKARESMEADGKLTADQVDQALDFTKRLFVPLAIAGVIFGNLLFGAIASLIGAALTKKKPVTPFDQKP